VLCCQKKRLQGLVEELLFQSMEVFPQPAVFLKRAMLEMFTGDVFTFGFL
jgi:hypothetical protein